VYTLYKYVIKETLLPFLIGLGGFVVFVSVELLYQLSDTIVRYRVGFDKLLLLLYYQLPYFLVMGIPVGALFSIFWVISRLSADNEIVAIQVHGINLKRLVIPFLIVSLVLSGLAYVLNDYLVPTANRKFFEAQYKYIYRKNPESFSELVRTNTFFKVRENQYFYIEEFEKSSNTFKDVLIYELGSKVTVTHAKRAKKEGNVWILEDGRVYTVDSNGLLSFDASFKRMNLDISQEIEEFVRSSKSSKEMTSRELKRRIENFKKLHVETAALEVEYQSKFATSLAPLIIVILGVPISLVFNIRTKSWSVILTFILVVLYQGSDAWISALGKEKYLPPSLAPWIPNLIFGLCGFTMFVLLDTKLLLVTRDRILAVFKRKNLLFIALLLIGAGTLLQGEIIRITAEEAVAHGETLVAEGNITVKYSDLTVHASAATITSEIATFSGNVRILSPDINETTGETLVVNDERATITNARFAEGDLLLISPLMTITFSQEANNRSYEVIESDRESTVVQEDRSYRVARFVYERHLGMLTAWEVKGKEKVKNKKGQMKWVNVVGPKIQIEIDDDLSTSTIYSGYITTCDLEEPHYRFEARRVVILPSKVLVSEDMFLDLLGVVVLYYPIYFLDVSGGKQPVEFSASFGSNDGFGFIVRNNFELFGGEGTVVYSYKEKGEEAGKKTYIEYTYPFNDYTSLKFRFDAPSKLGISYGTKLWGFSLGLGYNSESTEAGKKSSLGLTLKQKVGKREIVVTSSENIREDGAKVLIPINMTLKKYPLSQPPWSFQISNLGFKISSFANPGEFAFQKLGSGSLEFTMSGSYGLNSGEKVKNSGSLGLSLIRRDESLTSSLFLDHLASFDILNASAKNFMGSTTQKINLSVAGGISTSRNAERCGFKLSYSWNWEVPTKILSVGVGYTLQESNGRNIGAFKSFNADLNSISAGLTLKALPIAVVSLEKIGYDFKTHTWSNLELSTSSKWQFGSLALKLTSKTPIYIADGSALKKTSWQITTTLKTRRVSLNNTSAFAVDYLSGTPIESVNNKFSLRIGKLWYLDSFKFSGTYILDLSHGFEISKLDSKLEFVFFGIKHTFKKLRFYQDRWILDYFTTFHGWSTGISGTFYESGAIGGGKLTLGFPLHCWNGRLYTEFSKKSGGITEGWDVGKVSLTFYIKDFPEKFFSFSVNPWGFNAGIF